MDTLVQYTIPIKGLGPGVHEFDFHIDNDFFTHFENSPIQEGDLQLHLVFDKRADLFVLEFDFQGTVKADCDRCLAKIDLPIGNQQRLLVKFSLEEELEEAEVIYIHPEAQKLNVSKYIYEYICLAMPMIKVYDCDQEENRPCNEEMLGYLDNEEEENTDSNPIWDELKKLNKE